MIFRVEVKDVFRVRARSKEEAEEIVRQMHQEPRHSDAAQYTNHGIRAREAS